MIRPITCFLTIFFVLLYLTPQVAANSPSEITDKYKPNLNLRSLLIYLIKNHEEIKNLQSQVDQAKIQYSQSKGLYYPTMNLTGDTGKETIHKEFTKDTTENRYSVSLRASQLITDFGKTSETIDRSNLFLKQKTVELESTRQQLMLDGITAYINMVKNRERLKFARQSEERIKELTGIEKTLVEKKAGLSSDVLQVTSQLAGAKALRVFAEGELNIAKNRFLAIFHYLPTDQEIMALEEVGFPFKKLPFELDEALEIALKRNPELMITRFNTQIAQKDINIAKTAFYPRFSLFAEALAKDNEDGVEGYDNEASAGLEFSFNILNGGMDNAAIRSALFAKKSAAYRTVYIERLIREQVSNSWDQLTTLKLRSELLDEQAQIVKNFLELAKKERKMGTRSLLDVLTGEVNYINAIGTSIATKQDTTIAAYNLLFAMGKIGLALFEK